MKQFKLIYASYSHDPLLLVNRGVWGAAAQFAHAWIRQWPGRHEWHLPSAQPMFCSNIPKVQCG